MIWRGSIERGYLVLSCPYCSQVSLEISAVLSLPDDSRSDEICFQLFQCTGCGRKAAGAYEESRRGSLDSECVDHYAYQIAESDWERALHLIKLCPDPRQEDCGCCAHRQLGRKNEMGRWLGLKALEPLTHPASDQ